ncbi:MAG: hypothetical protein AB8G86_03060 [Saprospiraceae bacterium]
MKNILNCLVVLLFLIICTACTKEVAIPLIPTQSEFVNLEAEYQIDTIITFDAATFEETIEIVKTKIVARTPQPLNKTEAITLTAAEIGIYQIDTIITFDADTYEETIQVVKMKIKKQD